MKSCWFPAALALLAFTCDDAEGVPDDIGLICQRQARCHGPSDGGPAFDEDECRDRLSAEYDEASSYGCSGSYTDLLQCQATQRVDCPQQALNSGSGADGAAVDTTDDVNPCQGANDAFRRCQAKAHRDECVVFGFGGAGGCSIECALFSAECPAPGSPSEDSSCSCQTGDKSGSPFTGRCGADSLETNARSACQ